MMRQMSHLIVADGHYCGAEGEAQRWTALVDAAHAAGVDEISILGDFFELWLGLGGLFTDWQQALFEPLRNARQSGCRLRYVVGNKDYFVEAWNRREGLFDEVADPSCAVDSVAGVLHLAHGDLVNRADRQYRTWRAVSRSGPLP
jgi:UDP-2,3-diacylglucosamine pyrophosphatase LpxH